MLGPTDRQTDRQTDREADLTEPTTDSSGTISENCLPYLIPTLSQTVPHSKGASYSEVRQSELLRGAGVVATHHRGKFSKRGSVFPPSS